MHAYESMFIISSQQSEEQADSLIAKFEELITSNGGELVKTDRMGRRRLAYQIGDDLEGYYTVLYFNATGATVAELERVFKITDGVIRYLIIRKDD
ncbi:MAG: 30S ribosomal protein S6 [Clostridia bacterium]|nr:30S ribosomal protein S6 [Clostridia bacterium]